MPILSRDFSYYRGEFEAVNEQGKQYEDVVTEAWNRFNRDGDVLGRALEAADHRLNRPLDRMENQGDDYRRRLREGFLSEARRAGSNVQVIDADRPIESVQSDIWRRASQVLQSVSCAIDKPPA